jgi:hypothetical protein
MAVDTTTKQYDAMKEAGSWDLATAILGGTPTMRAAGTDFLPKEPQEEQANYDVRIARSFLYNAYDETIEKYVSRPFSRPATWDVKNPEAKAKMEPIMEDMDGDGLHHQDFTKEYFRMMLRWGVVTAYVDYPRIDEPENTTQQDEIENNLRPINSILKTMNIIGWQTIEQQNGVEKLSQIRVKEIYIEDGEEWTQTEYEQIRVLDFNKWTLYRREKKKEGNVNKNEWVIADEGVVKINGKTPDFLPTVTAYAKKSGLMTALPPFLNLLWTNLELWQSCSDQKNILRFYRLGMLFGAGWSEEERDAGLVQAPTTATITTNPDATLNLVETNGQPAENGWKDIRDIMERLEVQGMDPMIQRLANVKATGIAANEDKSRSMVESWIDAVDIAMRKIIQLNLKWMGMEVALEDIEYNIHKDFVFPSKTGQEVKDVIEMRKMGDLSHVDFMKEMMRYGRLADGDATDLVSRAISDRGVGTGLFSEGQGGVQQQDIGAGLIGDTTQETVTVGEGI